MNLESTVMSHEYERIARTVGRTESDPPFQEFQEHLHAPCIRHVDALFALRSDEKDWYPQLYSK
jgi:hypothetical protein